jgi:hypothetical protein
LSGSNITKAVAVTDTGTGIFTVSGNFAAGSVITGNNAAGSYTAGTTNGSTYIGGTGNDAFSATVAQLTAVGVNDTVMNGGSGIDTLTITSTISAITDNIFTNISNMEKLTFTATTAESLTTGAGFNAAFANGVTVTSGAIAVSTGATYAMGLYNKAATINLTTSATGAGADAATSITTGSGADNVTVSAAAWVGAAGAHSTLSIATGAGNDIISVTTAAALLASTTNASVQITGGTGADAITVSAHANATTGFGELFTIAGGDSTTAAFDTITGFKMADATNVSDKVAFDTNTITAYAATAATGYTSAQLAVAVSAAGLVTLSGTSAAGISDAAAIAAIASVVQINNGDSALYVSGANYYIFNHSTTGDSVVELIGVNTATTLTTTAATVTNLNIFI